MQEQAITLVRNLVHGEPDSVDQIFADGGLLFQTIEKKLANPRPDISLQVCALSNPLKSFSLWRL